MVFLVCLSVFRLRVLIGGFFWGWAGHQDMGRETSTTPGSGLSLHLDSCFSHFFQQSAVTVCVCVCWCHLVVILTVKDNNYHVSVTRTSFLVFNQADSRQHRAERPQRRSHSHFISQAAVHRDRYDLRLWTKHKHHMCDIILWRWCAVVSFFKVCSSYLEHYRKHCVVYKCVKYRPSVKLSTLFIH